MACASRHTARVALRLACLAVAIPCAGATAYTGAGPVVTIELRPQVRAARPQLRLSDIAYLTTSDLPTLRRLMAMPVGSAPRPGASVRLDRDTLARWVDARSGFNSTSSEAPGLSPQLRWRGADETEIESDAQQLPGELVLDGARAALSAWLAQRSARAEVRALTTPRDLLLPSGTATLRVRPLGDQAQPTRRMLVWVDAWVDGRFARTTAVSFEVEAWAPLEVATGRIERGAALDPVLLQGATESRDVDLTRLRRGTPISANGAAAAEGSAQRLRRSLEPGEVLTKEHLEVMPAVTRGRWARLSARSGEVVVEGRVEVLQDGREGQVVRVKMPGASGEVLARVTGPGEVEVQP